jgi:hypothetical protein
LEVERSLRLLKIRAANRLHYSLSLKPKREKSPSPSPSHKWRGDDKTLYYKKAMCRVNENDVKTQSGSRESKIFWKCQMDPRFRGDDVLQNVLLTFHLFY